MQNDEKMQEILLCPTYTLEKKMQYNSGMWKNLKDDDDESWNKSYETWNCENEWT